MTKGNYINVCVLVLTASALFLASCSSDKSKGGAGGPTAESDSETIGQSYKMNDYADVLKEVNAYKQKIGYKKSAEYEQLEDEISDGKLRLMKLINGHPKLNEINAESAEVSKKLMESVSSKDKEAQKKWGKIAADLAIKQKDVMQAIPEIAELEKHLEDMKVKKRELVFSALSQTEEGKELADRQRAIMNALGL